MTLQRVNFILSCDVENCPASVDLETTDFERAKAMKTVVQDHHDWSYCRKRGEFYDLCPDHDEDDL